MTIELQGGRIAYQIDEETIIIIAPDCPVCGHCRIPRGIFINYQGVTRCASQCHPDYMMKNTLTDKTAEVTR